MSYERYYPNGWQSGATGGTPVTPEALAHFDQGIIELDTDLSSCGYGRPLSTIAASTEAEFEKSLQTIAAAMENHSTRQVKAMLSFLNFTTYSVVEIYKHSGGNQLIVTIRSPRNNGTTLQKVYTSVNGWNPIEWYNPPMDAGVEYRTTERYNNKTVLVQRIPFEKLTATHRHQLHEINHEIVDLVEVRAFAKRSSSPHFIEIPLARVTENNTSVSVDNISTELAYVDLFSDGSDGWVGSTPEVFVKYTIK